MSAPVIRHRKSSPRPPRFKAGARVAFVAADGNTYVGGFIRAYSPAQGSGLHYDIAVNGETATLFANGQQGRSVTVQREQS
jgi:hypothetical protein